jgi:hypothetical protein
MILQMLKNKEIFGLLKMIMNKIKSYTFNTYKHILIIPTNKNKNK